MLYNKNLLNKIPKNELRKEIMISADMLEYLIKEIKINDELLYLLHTGVGVYSRY